MIKLFERYNNLLKSENYLNKCLCEMLQVCIEEFSIFEESKENSSLKRISPEIEEAYTKSMRVINEKNLLLGN